jgi:hypothetical protein
LDSDRARVCGDDSALAILCPLVHQAAEESGRRRLADVSDRPAHVHRSRRLHEVDVKRTRHHHAPLLRKLLNTLAAGQSRILLQHHRVGALQHTRLLHLTPDARPKLQHFNAHPDDPDQQHAEDRDPGAAADDRVEQLAAARQSDDQAGTRGRPLDAQ